MTSRYIMFAELACAGQSVYTCAWAEGPRQRAGAVAGMKQFTEPADCSS